MARKIIVGLLMLGVSLVSQGALSPVASWTFPNSGTDLSPSKLAVGETATLTYNGTAADVPGTTTAWPAWEGTAAATRATQGSKDIAYFVFHITGAALSDWVITYAGMTAQSGKGAQNWGYSLNGTDYTPTGFTQPATLTTTWASYTVDFSGVSGLDSQSSVWFRVNGYDSGNGQFTFDNFQVSAVPEPVNVALGVFGFCAVVVGVGRRYLRKRS